MSEKKRKEPRAALHVSMSKENLYRLKEAVLKSRITMREYVHHALGLRLEEDERK